MSTSPSETAGRKGQRPQRGEDTVCVCNQRYGKAHVKKPGAGPSEGSYPRRGRVQKSCTLGPHD